MLIVDGLMCVKYCEHVFRTGLADEVSGRVARDIIPESIGRDRQCPGHDATLLHARCGGWRRAARQPIRVQKIISCNTQNYCVNVIAMYI